MIRKLKSDHHPHIKIYYPYLSSKNFYHKEHQLGQEALILETSTRMHNHDKQTFF